MWIKYRNASADHMIYDVLRGAAKKLSSNSTAVEANRPVTLTAFTSNGFTVDIDYDVNRASELYVAWNWKGNGSGVSNTDGTITSTVSANQDAGISIITYTGTGANATVGHGLGVAPKFITVKGRNAAGSYNWMVYAKTTATDGNGHMYLNLTNVYEPAGTSVWNNTDATSSVFSITSNINVNANTGTYIAYAFAEVDGFSSIGSYTGNGSTDGPFIYTGFRPAFVIVKRSDSATGGEWKMVDTKRMPYNWTCNVLLSDLPNAENTAESESTYGTDILSNGFKIRASHNAFNASGGTYIYIAFAENPFKYSNAR